MQLKTIGARYLGVLFANRTFELWDLKAVKKIKQIELKGAINNFTESNTE